MREKNGKREFKYFTITQWKQEQDYLREQHKKGWKFTRVSGFCCYHFEKAEPEDVVYQLDYNPEGIEHKGEYIQMFQDCGWEYLQDYVGYSYFRKPVCEMQGEEEIFCDDASRLDMMKRVFQGRMLPLVCIFFCAILPQLFLQGSQSGRAADILTIVFGILAGLYLLLFLWFGIQFWQYRKNLE